MYPDGSAGAWFSRSELIRIGPEPPFGSKSLYAKSPLATSVISMIRGGLCAGSVTAFERARTSVPPVATS